MYRGHREALLEKLRETRTAALIFTNEPRTRSNDTEYLFRPNSDFWYLTGFREPGACLLLLPGHENGESVLFARPRVKTEETWTGRRLGLERAEERFGVDDTLPIELLWDELPKLLKGYERVLYRNGEERERDSQVAALSEQLRRGARRQVLPPVEWVDPIPTLHEMRLHKSDVELERMRKAAAITCEAHTSAMAAARPGGTEDEIDALISYHFRKNGSTGPAYNNIVAGGENACILHYDTNDHALRDGDLLLIDAGCEWEYYAADVTRTFPINGRFSAEQRALYEVVLEAEKRSIEAVAPGVSCLKIHEVAQRVVCEGLVELGLLTGSVDENLEAGNLSRFFMHGTGHWLGLDVHDVGVYSTSNGQPRPFAPGMVTTVEPGIYVDPEDDAVDERWRGIGVRIEDDVLVTADGHEVLTAAAPKEVADVEAACEASLSLAGAS